jgi:SSS family solute:Na+ symporter
VFLLGLFWRRANGAGALAGLVVGVPLGVASWAAVELFGWFQLQFLYAAQIMFALGVVLVVGVSLLTPAPSEQKVEGHVWRPSDAAVALGTPWYRDYRYQSALLGLLTLGTVVWWW